ncbi:hypothetical protein ACFL57_03120 [Candidatus Margulisiibacteriota bacterium]
MSLGDVFRNAGITGPRIENAGKGTSDAISGFAKTINKNAAGDDSLIGRICKYAGEKTWLGRIFGGEKVNYVSKEMLNNEPPHKVDVHDDNIEIPENKETS